MNSDPTGRSIWMLSRALGRLTGRVTNIATQVVSTTAAATKSALDSTASVIGNSVSGMSDMLGKGKNYLIDATVGREPFPPLPALRYSSSKTPKFVSREVRPNSARGQRQTTQQPQPPHISHRWAARNSATQHQPKLDYHVAATQGVIGRTTLISKSTGESVAMVRSS